MSLLAAACGDDALDDPRDASFVGYGKADTGGIHADDFRATAVLRVANEATESELVEAALLSTTTASAIIEHRAGADGVLGTADDDPFDDLVELDDVPFVGPVAFQKLVDYATELGFITYEWRTRLSWATSSGDSSIWCKIEAPHEATELRFLVEATPGYYRIDVRDSSGTLVQTISPPFAGWTDTIEGNAATYATYWGDGYTPCSEGASEAVSYRLPVAMDDPMVCTSSGGWLTPNESQIGEGVVAFASVPNPSFFPEGTGCRRREVALPYVPPTDGKYTVSAVAGAHVSVRQGDCDGPSLACGGSSTTLELEGGVPVVLGVSHNSWTTLSVSRARVEYACDNNFDDDGDGFADCEDSDCADECKPPEICNNGIDDDNDNEVDCLDRECWEDASCGANECPGVDLGSQTDVSNTPVAGGSDIGSPEDTRLSCSSPTWPGGRYFEWVAPSDGTYLFRLKWNKSFYDRGIRVLDGSCDADVLRCDVRSEGGQYRTSARVDLVAGQTVIVEVGATRNSYSSLARGYGLEVIQEQ